MSSVCWMCPSQWLTTPGFRVLSEAERTAALYSLLQESTQVQIRFFITVLQQMARSDPVGAFLSPSNAQSAIGDQLEAKMASLGIKTPSSVKSTSSPGGRNFQRQSTGLLSPNSAGLYGSPSPDVAAALAVQRNKLKNNRTSAPGTLLGDSRSFTGATLDNVQEKSSGTGNAQGGGQNRPKSSDAAPGGSAVRSPRASGPLDDTLSPMSMGGSWASMVNTPIMAMLDDPQQQQQQQQQQHPSSAKDTAAKLDSAAAQLAQLSQQTAAEGDRPRSRHASSQGANVQGVLSGMYDQNPPGNNRAGSPRGLGGNNQQFNNFNIPTMSPNTLAGLQSPSGGMSNPANLQMMNTMAAMGGLNNMNSTQLLALQQQILQSQQQQQQMQQQQAGRMARPQRGTPFGTTGPTSPGQSARAPARTTPLGSPPSGPQAAPEEEVADISVLNDVPAWLRHLRLHKYTPNFEHSNWREMVLMDDHDLEQMGVAALGARRKMLKTFEAVRQKYGIQLPPEKQAAASASESASDSAQGGQTE